MREWFMAHRWNGLPALVIGVGWIIRALIDGAYGAEVSVVALLAFGGLSATAVVWIVWASVLIRRHGPIAGPARHASSKTKYF